MTISPLWHLHDFLDIDSASALIAGYDPSSIASERMSISEHVFFDCYQDLNTIKKALENAIKAGTLNIFSCETDFNGNEFNHLIELSELKRWLVSRGFKSGFLFEGDNINQNDPDYLNPNHPRYAPKLAACVSAWLAVSEPVKGKSPKQSLEKWLRENAARYGLNKDDGNPNEQGIDECSKIANWNLKGGAIKTPSSTNHPPFKDNPHTPVKSPATLDLDDEIPY
ncbi:MAG TPA: hypothetical protein PLU46_00035 [Thiotrichales bacterium]|nr:hypothetical protein [Thiotrichales bacterium]